MAVSPVWPALSVHSGEISKLASLQWDIKRVCIQFNSVRKHFIHVRLVQKCAHIIKVNRLQQKCAHGTQKQSAALEERERLGGIWSTLWEQGPSHFLIAVIIIVVNDVIIIVTMIFIINVICSGMIDVLMSLTLLLLFIPNTCHQKKIEMYNCHKDFLG